MYLCSLINEWFKPRTMSLGKAPLYSYVNPMMGVPSSYASMLTVSLSLHGFPRGVLGLATAQVVTSFGACTTLLLVWLRGQMHPSHLPSSNYRGLYLLSLYPCLDSSFRLSAGGIEEYITFIYIFFFYGNLIQALKSQQTLSILVLSILSWSGIHL